MPAVDFKKTERALYCPTDTPSVVDVPEMTFLTVDGAGDPNTAPAYRDALEALYALSYAIKMMKMGAWQPKGYFDYVVPPLEGLWRIEDDAYDGTRRIRNKSAMRWTSMIRQPDFVDEETFAHALESVHRKKPSLDTARVRLMRFQEGLCAQALHIGSYDDEPATVEKLSRFIRQSGYRTDFSQARTHHEIYLGDPRKLSPDQLKTIIRHPIAPVTAG